ncbi:hypothetical protein [Saccharopolyspora sp. NPDC002376]
MRSTLRGLAGFALALPLLLGAPALAMASPLDSPSQAPVNCVDMNNPACQMGQDQVIGRNQHHQASAHENASENPKHHHAHHQSSNQNASQKPHGHHHH